MRRSVFVLVLMLALAGCSTASKSASEPGTLWWKDCGASGAQCATLKVPLDYSKPDGETISLSLLRYRATSSKRRGALVINPGGPGAAGVAFLRETGRNVVSPSVAAVYDLVTWDPRGTGGSLTMDCGDRLDYLFEGVTYAPQTPDQRNAVLSANRRFADACAQRMGAKLSFIGTRDTVADLDRIRVALGETTLNYLGFSYGTYLGAEYANSFPTAVGRMVLDGAVNPALEAKASVSQQAQGFEKSIDAFFAACAATIRCTWAGTEVPSVAFQALSARIAARPVPVAFGASVGPAQFDIGVASMLYAGTAGWETLNGALNAIAKDDGQQLFAAFSSYVGRSPNGTYDSSYSAFLGIGCVDGPPVGTAEETFAFADALGRELPIFGTTSVNLNIACSVWSVAPTSIPGVVSAPDAGPMLIVAAAGDPATPLAWAEALHTQLSSSVLITAPGEQHTSYQQGNRCVDDAVNAYLLTGAAPATTVRCAA